MLTSAITGYSIFQWRWRGLIVERLGMILVVLVLPFTYSRAGLLNLVVIIVGGSLFLGSLKKPLSNQPLFKVGHGSGRLVASVATLLVIVGITIVLVGRRNSFFSRLWIYWTRDDVSLSGYLTSLGFDARLAYSQAAYNTYKEHPFFGVGLGNYAFYLEEMLPFRQLAHIPEVLRVITPEFGRDRLVTSKNFHLRLLAETGVVGSIAFLAFFIAHCGAALWLWLSPNVEERYWGAVSLIGLSAFLLSAFTFDSFVIPNMWVVFGMTVAAFRIFKSTDPNHNLASQELLASTADQTLEHRRKG
jgi:O-antigen ligase